MNKLIIWNYGVAKIVVLVGWWSVVKQDVWCLLVGGLVNQDVWCLLVGGLLLTRMCDVCWLVVC